MNSAVTHLDAICWESVCSIGELVADSGVAALVRERQIALFYLPTETPAIYAIDNWDPVGKAHVLCRGIVGDLRDQLVVASPLYKQHFSLIDGRCQELPEIAIGTYPVRLSDDRVEVAV